MPTTSSEHAAPPAEAHDHVVPVAVYVAVFAALLLGTALTVWASYIDLGSWNTPVALAIAFTKATLVAVFFMHLKYSPKLTWLAVGAALFWLFYLLAGTLSDYYSRGLLNPMGKV